MLAFYGPMRSLIELKWAEPEGAQLFYVNFRQLILFEWISVQQSQAVMNSRHETILFVETHT